MAPCDQCPGYCCFRSPGAVLLVTAVDINRLARHFGISDHEVRRRYLENRYTFKVGEDGACVFLAPGRASGHCSVYEARPDQCRRFPCERPCPYLERE
ncbi:MAG: YkgJ family cysteine cluster protein [Desulfobulbaceae bacterium]|nr:YkgJ family cysteine cluster protein [Desulfobulbaceae bacterium]